MTVKEALLESPKVTALLGEWFLNKMLEAIKKDSVPEDFVENVRASGAPLENIIPLIEMNPASVFVFFDSQGVFILPTRGGNKFSATVNAVSIEKEFENRRDAEEKGLIKGIQELELILEQDEHTQG